MWFFFFLSVVICSVVSGASTVTSVIQLPEDNINKTENDTTVAFDDSTNIAKEKPMQQSTTHSPQFDANYAIDENIYTQQQTAVGDVNPWWRVDLQQPYSVEKVAVYASPGYEKRFHDVTIVVSNKDIRAKPPNRVFYPGKDSICANHIGSEFPVNPKWTTFTCRQAVIGRYVSIQITSDCQSWRKDCNLPKDQKDPKAKHILQMMEVKVHGKAVTIPNNLAKGKPVLQSTTLGDRFVAQHATDGNIFTMQHTACSNEFPWWRVDLLEPYNVQKVSIFARPRYEQRFHDVIIFVSNEDISKIPLNTTFSPNPASVCADNIGTEKPVGPKWTIFECKQVVVGRYVSIQITADCNPKRSNCIYPEDKNKPMRKQLLQMQEVEVFGELAPKA